MNHDHFIVPPGTKIRLKDYDPGFTGSYKTEEEASPKLRKDIQRLAKLQNVLYADDTHALLVVLQRMDAAGKDGTVRNVMSGVNPQGARVRSSKAPSAEELEHDFLWRSTKTLPERGGIGIFDVIGMDVQSRHTAQDAAEPGCQSRCLHWRRAPQAKKRPLIGEGSARSSVWRSQDNSASRSLRGHSRFACGY